MKLGFLAKHQYGGNRQFRKSQERMTQEEIVLPWFEPGLAAKQRHELSLSDALRCDFVAIVQFVARSL
jgi:hypothetical protein